MFVYRWKMPDALLEDKQYQKFLEMTKTGQNYLGDYVVKDIIIRISRYLI